MKTLADCLDKAHAEGYREQFMGTDNGLKSTMTNREYNADEIKVVDYHRFEGASDPDDSSVLYVIETNDGHKGTLTDAYGMYADPNVARLISEVEKINKKGVEKK
jgi:hypothetical protein